MKKNLPIIIISICLVLALAGNAILYSGLLKEQGRNENLQATFSELQEKVNETNTLHTELANANKTIADLEEKVGELESFNATIGTTTTAPAEEITAEMLENISASLDDQPATPESNTTASQNNQSTLTPEEIKRQEELEDAKKRVEEVLAEAIANGEAGTGPSECKGQASAEGWSGGTSRVE